MFFKIGSQRTNLGTNAHRRIGPTRWVEFPPRLNDLLDILPKGCDLPFPTLVDSLSLDLCGARQAARHALVSKFRMVRFFRLILPATTLAVAFGSFRPPSPKGGSWAGSSERFGEPPLTSI